jgi:putative DNA primase/helicase
MQTSSSSHSLVHSFEYFRLVGVSDGTCSCGCARADCNSRGKHPYRAGWQGEPALTPEQANDWLTQGFNVGIRCGKAQNLFVLDVDVPKKAGDDDGRITLLALETTLGRLPSTYTVATGSGGLQYYFQHPADIEGVPTIKNAVKFAPGLDERTTGGLVVAAGSTHHSGNLYENSINKPLAVLPEAWQRYIAANQGSKNKKTCALTSDDIPDGQRDNTLARIAGTLRGLKLDEEGLYNAIAGVNQRRCKPPLPESDVRRIAHSIASYAPREEKLRRTETWAAEQFATLFQDDCRYCHDLKEWRVWDGMRWAPDDTGNIHQLVKKFVMQLYGLAVAIPDEDERKAMMRFITSLETRNKRAAIETLAQSERPMVAMSTDFDTNLEVLNIENGTLDLLTFELRQHDRGDLISQLAPVTYDAEAKCPAWDTFMLEICNDQKWMVDFLQEAFGYTLTGSIREGKCFLLRGDGRNGKGTMTKIVELMLGSYAQSVRIETFIKLGKESNSPRDGKRQMYGKRFVRASETEQGQRLAEGKLKELVSPDGKISAGVLWQDDDLKFTPTGKIWIASNNDLRIVGTDLAIWSRIVRLDFVREFIDTKCKINLADELLVELPGILNWCLIGLRRYREAKKLLIPDQIKEATNTYRREEDSVRRFLEEEFDFALDEPLAIIPGKELYAKFQEWANENGCFVLNHKQFSIDMDRLVKVLGLTKIVKRRFAYYQGLKHQQIVNEPMIVETPTF